MRLARYLGFGLFCLSCAREPAAPFARIDATSVDAHAWQGVLIRDAIVRGDLPEAKRAASGLIALAMKYERPSPDSRLDAMVQSAERVANAQDLSDAAASFAFLAERCGECHASTGGPSSLPSRPPPQTLGVVPRMQRHQWGAARLWEGLVAPSREAWASGAEVLSDAPLGADTLPDRTAVPELAALSTSVHDLGVEATRADKASVRIAVYGKLLNTCASCHQRVSGGPRW